MRCRINIRLPVATDLLLAEAVTDLLPAEVDMVRPLAADSIRPVVPTPEVLLEEAAATLKDR